MPGIRHPFVPPANVKGVFAGAGGCFADPHIAQAVIDLTGLPTFDISVLYIGTASCKSHWLFVEIVNARFKLLTEQSSHFFGFFMLPLQIK